jgi:hypothetical protein
MKLNGFLVVWVVVLKTVKLGWLTWKSWCYKLCFCGEWDYSLCLSVLILIFSISALFSLWIRGIMCISCVPWVAFLCAMWNILYLSIKKKKKDIQVLPEAYQVFNLNFNLIFCDLWCMYVVFCWGLVMSWCEHWKFMLPFNFYFRCTRERP